MLYVVNIKPLKGGYAKALLSDGRFVKVLKDSFAWGSVVDEADIIADGNSYYHKNTIIVSEKKEYDYGLCRDLTGYDPKAELKMIKDFVDYFFFDLMGRSFYDGEFSDVVSYCVEACVRRHVYEKFSPTHGASYKTYLKSIVFNLLRDYRRSLVKREGLHPISLNYKIKDSTELLDYVTDGGLDVCEKVEYEVMLNKLSVRVTRLDKEGTGLPGFSYKDLFDTMINGESLDAYLSSFKYPRKLLDEYVYDFRSHMREELVDLGVAC